MKILIINNNSNVVGGNDAAAINQYKLFNKEQIESSFFSRENFAGAFNLDKKISFLNYFFNKKSKKALENLISETRPDIIHIHSFSGIISNSLLSVLKKSNIKSVLTVHDYKLICPISSCLLKGSTCTRCSDENSPSYVVRNKCNRDSYLFSGVNYLDYKIANNFYHQVEIIDHYIFVSKFSYNLHKQYYSILEDKSSIISNFYLSTDNSYASKDNYLLYVGRLSEEKGILKFLKIFVKSKDINFDFYIAGEGLLKDEILELSKADNRIKILGFIDGEKKEQIIKKAKYMVLPSQWYENNPISLIESLSFGTPVISTNIGGIPEIIENNINGLLFQPFSDNAITEVLEKAQNIDEVMYTMMCESAENKYQKEYTASHYLSKTMKLYENLYSK